MHNAEGMMLSKRALEQKYGFQNDQMTYNSLIDANPTSWRTNTCSKTDNLHNKYIAGDLVFDIRKITNRML